MLLPEDLCNLSPGFSALVIREETPSPLPVGCLTDGLMKLNRQHCVMVSPRYSVVFILAAESGPALSDRPFRLGVPHQARVQTLILEVHAPHDNGPDLSGPADAQRLRKNDVGED